MRIRVSEDVKALFGSQEPVSLRRGAGDLGGPCPGAPVVPWGLRLAPVCDRDVGFAFAVCPAVEPTGVATATQDDAWGCAACVFDSEPEHTCGAQPEVLLFGPRSVF